MILALDYTYGIKRHKGFCIRFSQSLPCENFRTMIRAMSLQFVKNLN